MQMMRYLNLFNRITGLSTRFCFKYNDGIVFAVPKKDLMRALGREASNLRRLGEVIRKRVKIVAAPNGMEDLNSFVSIITYPVKFKSIDVRDGEAVINANIQSAFRFPHLSSLHSSGYAKFDDGA